MMSRATYKRATRVADQIRMEVADILMRKTKDPRLRFVTVTDVEVGDDLRIARVFVTTLDSTQEGEVMEGLAKAAGFVRTELGRRLRLRYTPEVMFVKDTSGPRGDRVLALLEEAEKKARAGATEGEEHPAS
jgi:ribosome-binding factor A